MNPCRKNQYLLCPAFPVTLPDQNPCKKSHQNGDQRKEHIFGLSPGIKNKAYQQKHDIFKSPGHRKIQCQYHGQKVI